MQSHHTIYTGESLQARDVLLNSAHSTVDPTLIVCYHAHCSHSIYELVANKGGIV